MALINLTESYPLGYIPSISEWNGIFSDINASVNGIDYTQCSGFYIDEDNMASDSATRVPTQQSTKAYVDNTVSNLQIAIDDYRIIAGYDDIWGTPGFVVSGTANDVTVKASASDPLQLYINGTLLSITGDIAVSSFNLASAGVSATISAGFYNAASAFSRTEMEFGDTETIIDGYASAWTAANVVDRIQAFKTGSEYLLAKPSKKSTAAEMSLSRGIRGIGNSSRAILADNDVVYLKQINVLLCGADKTMYVSPQYPLYQATAPASGTTGEFYKSTSTKLWYRWNGASWDQIDAIPLAVVVCDESGVVAIEHFDFDKAWNEINDSNIYPIIEGTSAFSAVSGCSAIGIEINEVNVAGTKISLPSPTEIVPSAYLISSETWASATLYYAYVTPLGEFKISNSCPRDKSTLTGKRKGYYHSKYSWRCIGNIYVRAFTDIIHFNKSNNIYLYTGPNDFGFERVALTTSRVTYQFKYIPPFIKNIFHMATLQPNTATNYKVRSYLRNSGRYSIILTTTDGNSNDPTGVTQPVVMQNSTIDLDYTAGTASHFAIYGFSVVF